MSDRVYVIASSAGMVKIGISVNPIKRMAGLRTAHPYVLTLFREFERPRGDARDVEQTAHRILSAKRRSGTEWFDVTPEDAVAAVEKACDANDAFRLPSYRSRKFRNNADDPDQAEAFASENPGALAREVRKWIRR